MTKEMYAANVKNWLMNLATGAKAMKESVRFTDEETDRPWRVTASCYYQFEDGVWIHGLKSLAESIDVPVHRGEFTPENYLHNRYSGYYYFDMFGVRFCDLIV